VPRSQITTATLAGGTVEVTGPIIAAEDEKAFVPLTIHVVLVQPDAYAHGHGTAGVGRDDGLLGWTVHADADGMPIARGPALATGLLVYVDRRKGGEVPLPQTVTWTENVAIT